MYAPNKKAIIIHTSQIARTLPRATTIRSLHSQQSKQTAGPCDNKRDDDMMHGHLVPYPHVMHIFAYHKWIPKTTLNISHLVVWSTLFVIDTR